MSRNPLVTFLKAGTHPKWSAIALSLAISTSLIPKPAQAEGSRDLFPQGVAGNRANLEWRTAGANNENVYGNLLQRRTLLKVYAEPGEFILLGSSAVGVDQGDVLLFRPGQVTGVIGAENVPINNPEFRCSTQRSQVGAPANQGRILSRAQELAGPDTIPGGTVTNGYIPCFYQVPPTGGGVYDVVFLGPSGNAPTQTLPSGSIDPIQTLANQGTSVAAWDVTVRRNLTTPQNEEGRLFAFYLALFTGANNRPVNSTVFTLTTDGFRYQTDLRGIDPNGFVVYGNRVGFLDSNGEPLNRDVVATDNLLTNLQGNVSIARPEFPIFFNDPPAANVLLNLGIPVTTQAPGITQNSFSFTGTVGGNTSLVSTGGTFNYEANVDHVYEIIISRDGVDFDPTNPLNRVLRGVRPRGGQAVTWNGLDNLGNPFPAGTNYPVRLTVRAGEYHFPLLDVENSFVGSPIYTLLNPPGACPPLAGGCSGGFYDDRGYRTASGDTVGQFNVVLPGADPPNPPSSDFTVGFDTRSGQRRFGNRTDAGFGDKKGLDLWTFYPSTPAQTTLNIVAAANADLSLTKVADRTTVVPGQNVTFTITLTNAGPADATNVAVTERLPAGLTFVAATPSQGTYDNASGLWTVGTVANGGNATLQVVARIDTTESVTNTAEVTASDQPDPNSTPSNNNPQENDQSSTTLGPAPTADLSLTKTVDNPVTTVGQNVTFTITLTNAGPAEATNVAVTERLPAGLTFVSATPSQGTYDNASGLWTIGTVANGGNATLQVVARVDTTESLTNTAEVTSSDQIDPNSTPGNNNPQENDQSSVAIGGTPSADLSLTKTLASPPTALGQNITFTIALRNAGPASATNVVVTERLPAGLTFVSATPSQGTYNNANGQWAVGTVANGGNATLQVVARVDTTESLTNTAEVTASDQPDPNSTPGNNNPQENDQSSVAIEGILSADLSLTKTLASPPTALGQNITFTIALTNAGPANATNVVVSERLPAGLTFVSATPSQGTYNNANGQWAVGTVANGGNATLQIVARVDTTESVTNTAEVTASDQADPNSTPNNNNPQENDQASRVVEGIPNLRLVKRITAIARSGNTTRFSTFANDPDDPDDDAAGWSQFSPVGVTGFGADTPLRSSDLVEYTLYFLSDGGRPATAVNICDQIPVGTTFVPDSFSVGGGIQLNRARTETTLSNRADTDPGTFFSPLAPLPTENPCRDAVNPNGSVLVNVGDVSNVAGSNFGFVRFQVRVD